MPEPDFFPDEDFEDSAASGELDGMLQVQKLTFAPDEEVLFRVRLTSPGERAIFTTIVYTVYDASGTSLLSWQEAVSVDALAELFKRIPVGLAEGTYTLIAVFTYDGQEEQLQVEQTFTVGEPGGFSPLSFIASIFSAIIGFFARLFSAFLQLF